MNSLFRKAIIKFALPSGRSGATNLLAITNDISLGFFRQLQTDEIYRKFCKALDKVIRKILIRKLSRIGLSDHFLVRWSLTFMREDFQFVGYKVMAKIMDKIITNRIAWFLNN